MTTVSMRERLRSVVREPAGGSLREQLRAVVREPIEQQPMGPGHTEPGDPGYADPVQFATPLPGAPRDFDPRGLMPNPIDWQAGQAIADQRDAPPAAPFVAGMPAPDQEARNRSAAAVLGQEAMRQQEIAQQVPYAARAALGVAGALGNRLNEAAGQWRDLGAFYTGGEQTGEPANIVNPGILNELSQIGGTVTDPIGSTIMQAAPAAAEFIPIDPVGLATMFLSHPLTKAVKGAPGFQAARAQFLTEVQAKMGGRVAGLASNAIDDAIAGGAFGGINAGARGENPIVGAGEGAAFGVGLGGVMRGAGSVAKKMRGVRGVAVPLEVGSKVDAAQAARDYAQSFAQPGGNRVNAGSDRAPIERVSVAPQTESGRVVEGANPSVDGRVAGPRDAPQQMDAPTPQDAPGNVPSSEQSQGPTPLDRPSIEAEATRLGVPFDRRTRTVDLRRAVEEARSGPSSIRPTPESRTAPLASLDQPTETRGIYGEASETPPAEEASGVRRASETSSVQPSPSPTPSPAEGRGALLRDAQKPAQVPEAPSEVVQSPQAQIPPIAGIEPRTQSAYQGNSDTVVRPAKIEGKSAQPSPNPTPRERQAWEMTRGEFRASVRDGNEPSDRRWAMAVSDWKNDGRTPPDRAYHREVVSQALRENRPVPPEVLKDYPDLVPPSTTARAGEVPAAPVEATSPARSETSPPKLRLSSAASPIATGDFRPALKIGDHVGGSWYDQSRGVNSYTVGRVLKVRKSSVDIATIDGETRTISDRVGKYEGEDAQKIASFLQNPPDLAAKANPSETPKSSPPKEPTSGKVQEEEGQPQGLLKDPTPPPAGPTNSPAGGTVSPPDYPPITPRLPPDSPVRKSLGQRIRDDAHAKLDAIEKDTAARRKKLKPGQRLGHSNIVAQATLYAQIGVGHALDAIEAGAKQLRKVTEHVRDAMKARGVDDPAIERRASRIARAMMKDATGDDGSIDPQRLREIIQETDAEITPETRTPAKFNTETATDKTPKGKNLVKQAAKDAREGMLTPGQALKGSMQREARAVDKLASSAVRAIRQTERQARREGKREGAEAVGTVVDDLRERLRREVFRERIKGRMEASELKRQSDYREAMAEHVAGLRQTLVDTIEASVRPEKQAKLLAMVPEVKTRVEFQRVLDRLAKSVDESLVNQAKGDAKTARKLTGKTKLGTLSKDRAAAANLLATEAKRLASDATLSGHERATKVRRTLEAIQSLHFEQKHENTVYINGRKRKADVERANAINALSKRKPLASTTDGRDAEGDAGFLRRWYHRAMIPRVLARYLDRGKTGPFQRIIKTFDTARRDGLDLERQFFQKADAIVQGVGYKNWADFMARVSGTLGRSSQEMVKVNVGGVTQISKGQAMSILAMDPETRNAASRGQKFNFKTRPDGEAFELTNAIRQQIYDALTPQEINAVTLLKKLKEDQHLEKLDGISMRLLGRRLERVPEHWSIERNRNKMEGGVPKTWQQAWVKHGEDAGFFKDREGGKIPILVGDFGADLTRRVKSEAFIISHADAIRAAEQVLLHPEVTGAITSRVGMDVNERIKGLMTEVSGATYDDQSMGWINRPARALVSNVASALTQVNPLTWGRNLGGLAMLPARLALNPKYTAAGMKALGTMRVGELVKESPIFWERYTRGSHTIFDPVRGAEMSGEAGFLRAGAATVREAAKAGGNALALRGREAKLAAKGSWDAWTQMREAIRWGNWFDSASARFTMGYKLAEVRDLNPGWSDAKQRAWALRQTEKAFTETQNTSDPLNSSGFAAAGRRNPAVGAVLSFTGDVAKKQNLIIEGVLEYQETGNFKPLLRNAGLVAISTLLSSYLINIGWGKARQMMGGEEENLSKMEETKDRAMWQASKELVTSLLPGGGAVGWATGLVERALRGPRRGDDFIDVPALSVAGEFADAGQKMLAAIDDAMGEMDSEKQAKAIDRLNTALGRAGRAGGTMAGAPMPPVNMVLGIVKARREADLAALRDAMTVLRKKGQTSGKLYREMAEAQRNFLKATPEERDAIAADIRAFGREAQRMVRDGGSETASR